MTQTTAFEVSTAGVWLDADLLRPERAHGVVLCAHTGGDYAAQEEVLAEALKEHGLASVVVDLTAPADSASPAEAPSPVDSPSPVDAPYPADSPSPAGNADGDTDAGNLADRLLGVVDWLITQPDLEGLPVGLFGAGATTPAVLLAAAARTQTVRAVACLGGRADLAGPALPDIAAPTLMICAEHDTTCREIAQQARTMMEANAELRMIATARPAFDDPGTLVEAIDAARGWLDDHIRGRVRQ